MLQKGTIVLLTLIGFSLGCGPSSRQSLDREIEIAVRGGLGKLSESEKQSLLAESNGVLLRLSDPSLRKIVQLFAGLPSNQRSQLQNRSFLKWKVKDLDPARQELLDRSFSERARIGDDSNEWEETLNLLHASEIGFVEVELPSSGVILISFYVLWANGSPPSYVTVVGSSGDLRTVEQSEYHGVHGRRLRMINSLANSELPPPSKSPMRGKFVDNSPTFTSFPLKD